MEWTAIEGLHGPQRVLPRLKVDKGVVLDLLDALDGAVGLKGLLEPLLRALLREIPDVEDLHFGHGVVVRLLLGVRPVHDDVAAEDLDPARAQPALGKGGGLVGVVLEEAEAPILPPVIRGAVNDHLRKSGCIRLKREAR